MGMVESSFEAIWKTDYLWKPRFCYGSAQTYFSFKNWSWNTQLLEWLPTDPRRAKVLEITIRYFHGFCVSINIRDALQPIFASISE